MVWWSNWLAHLPFTEKVTGSNPVQTIMKGDIAQLVEQ